VPDGYRGRVFGSLGTAQALAMLGGMGLAALLGDPVGVIPTMLLASLCFLAAGMLALQRLGGIGPERKPEEEPSARSV